MGARGRENKSSQSQIAEKLYALSSEQLRHWIAAINDDEAEAILHDWAFWARPNQLEPAGVWVNWLVMAGRGFGKTRMGAEQVRKWAQEFPIVNLVGPTSADIRDVMVQGIGAGSAIMEICGQDEKPVYEKSKRRLVWPNGEITEGATASAFLNQADVNFDSISHSYVCDSAGRHYKLSAAPWQKRWASKIRYKWSNVETTERPSSALANAVTDAQVLDALEALQRGEDVGQRILAYLAEEQFIVVRNVNHLGSPRGEREYLFINFTEKGQRLLDSTQQIHGGENEGGL